MAAICRGVHAGASCVASLSSGKAARGREGSCIRLLHGAKQGGGARAGAVTRRDRLVIRAAGMETEQRGLTRHGITQGGRWLSCTTRHVRLYVGYIDPKSLKMDQTQLDKLSLMLDTDEEFLWTEASVQKVWDQFQELVDNYAGAELTEYTLRLIGSDLEHFIRKLLLANEIVYNLNARVLNFSMGKPRFDSVEVEATAAAEQ